MKYGLLVFKNSRNIGDDIQAYATRRFLPHTDYIIDREKLDSFYTETGEKVAVIMAGWYLYDHLSWPPSPFIKPLPISMHFDTIESTDVGGDITRNFIFEDYGASWFLENGPTGCRDKNTETLLKKFCIPSYFSGCITLTLEKFEDVEKHGRICLVDIPKVACEYIIEKAKTECVEMTQIAKNPKLSWESREKRVEQQLQYYQGASLVVTTRLHVALPCLALGVPVLLIKEDASLNRIGTYLKYINHVTIDELISGEFNYDFDNPLQNSEEYKLLSDKITERCSEFIKECETAEFSEKLDVELFLDGNKRVERLKRLMRLRVDKFEKELHSH